MRGDSARGAICDIDAAPLRDTRDHRLRRAHTYAADYAYCRCYAAFAAAAVYYAFSYFDDAR